LALIHLPIASATGRMTACVRNRFLGGMIRRDEFNALADFLLKRQSLEEQFVERADAGLVGLLFL